MAKAGLPSRSLGEAGRASGEDCALYSGLEDRRVSLNLSTPMLTLPIETIANLMKPRNTRNTRKNALESIGAYVSPHGLCFFRVFRRPAALRSPVDFQIVSR